MRTAKRRNSISIHRRRLAREGALEDLQRVDDGQKVISFSTGVSQNYSGFHFDRPFPGDTAAICCLILMILVLGVPRLFPLPRHSQESMTYVSDTNHGSLMTLQTEEQLREHQ